MSSASNPDPRIHVSGLTMAYGSFVIQRDLDFVVERGEVFVVVGGSGGGKGTLLNHMVGLKHPARGDVVYDGESFWGSPSEARDGLRRRLGVSFQAGALWSSLTLAENVGLPLQTFTRLPAPQIREIVALKLALVGLAGYGSSIRPRSAAGCSSGPAWRAPWRSTRISCSSTSRRLGSIRSARAGSTTSSWNCATAWAPRWWSLRTSWRASSPSPTTPCSSTPRPAP